MSAADSDAEILAVFRAMGARPIRGPLPPGRILERVEGFDSAIVVELVAVSDEEYEAAKARGAYDDAS
jgi:hypothetical protein